jgi:serine phosphatase RsbU (regulator of sigma subunit)
MFHRNETQAFMDSNFEPQDYQYIYKKAREADGQHRDAQRKEAQVEFNEARIEKRLATREARKEKAERRAERVAAVKLIFDKDEIKKLKGQSLKDHLDAFKKAGAPIPSNITAKTLVGQIREALVAAIDSYHNKSWVPKVLPEPETDCDDSDSREEFDLGGEESDLEEEEV